MRVHEFPIGTLFESESVSYYEINQVFHCNFQLISTNNRHLEVVLIIARRMEQVSADSWRRQPHHLANDVNSP